MKKIKTYSSFINEDNHEQIPGGKSSGMTLMDIAKMHAYDDSSDSASGELIQQMLELLNGQLEKGRKYEMEHTDNPEQAEEIALDHLAEDPEYYNKLEAAGLAD